MTAKMWELHSGTTYTGFDVTPPVFKPNLVLAYGANVTGGTHGVVENDQYNSGMLSWGCADIDRKGVVTTFALLGNPVEESASAMTTPSVGGAYYDVIYGATSVFTGSQSLAVYDCGGVDINGGILSNYYGAMLLSGKTLNSHVGVIDASAAGSVAVTGVGFQPDLILVGSAAKEFYGGPYPSFGQVGGFCFGAADAALNQFACSARGSFYITGGGIIRTSRMTASHCGLTISHNATGAVLGSFALTSMDTDGFTVNVDNATDNIFFYIAIKDPSGVFKVGTATAGDVTLSTGRSEAMLFGSAGTTSFDVTAAGPAICMGGATKIDGTELSGWAGGRDQSGFTVNSQYWDTKAISLALATASVPTVNTGAATIASWDASSVDLSWSAGGSSGIKFGWVSLATSSHKGYDGCGGEKPQIYRWVQG